MIQIRLFDLAKKLNAELYGGDNDLIITGVASIDSAKSGHITFLGNDRFRNKLSSCQASAVILSKNNLIYCHNSAALVVKNPYLAYIKVIKLMNIVSKKSRCISPGSSIASDVVLGKNIGIGVNAIIESGVILGNNVVIGSGSFIGRNTMIGDKTNICSNVVVHHNVKIGSYCLIKSGAIIGSDGFGYIKSNNDWIKIPQLGGVIIGNNVSIGSCTTIDRGTLDDTEIGKSVVIDNQCHIAHNVVIGDFTAIAGGVIMAGSLKIGQNCMIGGASVINGHISICDKVTITGMSMVMKSITEPGIYSSGIPVQKNKIWRKTAVLVMRIDNINKKIKIIEKKLKENLFFVFILYLIN